MLEQFPDLKRKVFAPFVFKVNPNYITAAAFIVSIFAGYFFFQKWVLLAAMFVFLNGFLDALDGEVAKTFNLTSKFGDFLDHALDRLADVAIFLGIILGGYVSELVGFSTIIVTLLVSYVGTQAQAITGKRLYTGFMGRSDRLALLFLAGIVSLFYESAIYYAILIILALSLFTFFQRFYLIFQQLKRES